MERNLIKCICTSPGRCFNSTFVPVYHYYHHQLPSTQKASMARSFVLLLLLPLFPFFLPPSLFSIGERCILNSCWSSRKVTVTRRYKAFYRHPTKATPGTEWDTLIVSVLAGGARWQDKEKRRGLYRFTRRNYTTDSPLNTP